MKKFIILLIMLAVLPYSSYANVSDWASDDVERAEGLGFLQEELGIYDFTQSITREKFCELSLAFLKTSVHAGISRVQPSGEFSDTENEDVLTLCSAGIIAGRGNGVFAPDDFITREEAAAILRRMSDFMGFSSPSAVLFSGYSDFEDISQWARGDVSVMYEMGVMNGVSDTEFSPKAYYTAEQAVSTMVRLFEYFEENLLFVDGEVKVNADVSVKYNTSFAWIEDCGNVIHRCLLSEKYGYFCYFEEDDLRIALLDRGGFSEVYDSGFENLLFTVRGKLVSADTCLTAEYDGAEVCYSFDGTEIQ